MQPDVDENLRLGKWPAWRNSLLGVAGAPAEAARVWLCSSHWETHTPFLEDWKTVMADLAARPLSEGQIAYMAEKSKGRHPFPLIPLFEHEQVIDLLKVTEFRALDLLATFVANDSSMLTVNPRNAVKLCWESSPRSFRESIEFQAWCWLVPPREGEQIPWPSRRGAEQLRAVAGPRGQEALKRLREAVSASADPQIEELRQLLFPPVRKPAPPAALPPYANRQQDPYRQPAPVAETAEPAGNATGQDAELAERLCMEILAPNKGMSDLATWRGLEQQALAGAGNPSVAHPLSPLVAYLRGHEFQEADEDTAWKNLSDVFRMCPGLLSFCPSMRPLPALELSACVRSETPIGRVACDLIGLIEWNDSVASPMESPSWWMALRSGLKPLKRRGGLEYANDRIVLAVFLVRSMGPLLDRRFQQAMKQVFIPEENV